MTKENLQRIHRVYSVCLGLVIIIAGICFIAACLSIYNSGEQPFTRESVATAFDKIAIPVYICFVMTVIGIIFDVVSHIDAPKHKPDKPYETMLKKAYNTKDIEQCDADVRQKILKEKNTRRLHSIIRTVLLCIASIIFLIYATNQDNFHQSEITESMINAMWILLPCLAVCFAYTLFTVIYNEKSIIRELELMKSVPSKVSVELTSSNPSDGNSSCNLDKIIMGTRIALLIIGVGILIYGFATGGTMDVLTKAINICTECIGLG